MKWQNIDTNIDALTGGPLIGDVFKCQECQCLYGRESIEHLQLNNGGQCLQCEKKEIHLLTLAIG